MHRALLAGASFLLIGAGAAHAQSPADFLPPDPGVAPRAEEEVTAPEDLEAAGTASPAAPGQGPTFQLNGIALEGAAALGEAELSGIWADLIGTQVSLATLDDIAARIGAAYRANGYVLSQAILPEQTVSDGVVRIVVVEGFVDQVDITGGAPNQQANARALFERVPADRPLRLRTLERGVLLSRDTFGQGVETVLEPSPSTFGAADLSVLINPEPISYFVTADNRGSRLYGSWTVSTGSRSYNLLGQNERIDTLLSLAPNRTSLAYASVIYDRPFQSLYGTRLDGGRLELRADFSRADPDMSKSGSPDTLQVVLDETNVRAGMIVPFVRTRSENFFGRAGIAFREAKNGTDLDGAEDESTDRLIILDLQGTWDIADRFGGVNLIDIGLYQGLDIAGAKVGAEGPAAGVPDFTKVSGRISRLQRLGGEGWALFGEAIGQYAFNNLPNSERFSIGGGSIGRGFAPGNNAGDSGYGARLELRRNLLADELGGQIQATQIYAFGDYGAAYDRAEERDDEQWETLASFGIGARIDINDRLTITPEIARQANGQATDTTDTGLETRFYIGAVARF